MIIEVNMTESLMKRVQKNKLLGKPNKNRNKVGIFHKLIIIEKTEISHSKSFLTRYQLYLP